jgi:hypothetical protein
MFLFPLTAREGRISDKRFARSSSRNPSTRPLPSPRPRGCVFFAVAHRPFLKTEPAIVRVFYSGTNILGGSLSKGLFMGSGWAVRSGLVQAVQAGVFPEEESARAVREAQGVSRLRFSTFPRIPQGLLQVFFISKLQELQGTWPSHEGSSGYGESGRRIVVLR